MGSGSLLAGVGVRGVYGLDAEVVGREGQQGVLVVRGAEDDLGDGGARGDHQRGVVVVARVDGRPAAANMRTGDVDSLRGCSVKHAESQNLLHPKQQIPYVKRVP